MRCFDSPSGLNGCRSANGAAMATFLGLYFADLRPRLTLIQWRYETLSYGKERTAAADGAAAAAKALKTWLTLTYVKDPCANSACTADPVARRSYLTAPSLEDAFLCLGVLPPCAYMYMRLWCVAATYPGAHWLRASCCGSDPQRSRHHDASGLQEP